MYFILLSVAIFSVVYTQPSPAVVTEACDELQDAYLDAYETAEHASVPCKEKLGNRNCVIFNAMYVSALRKNLNAIAADMGCGNEEENMNLEKACAQMANIGTNSTIELAEVFLAVKTGPLAEVAEEVLPSMAAGANELVSSIKTQFCS